ncbi:hypothetical protein ACFHWS_19135 [Micromonospora sp. LOL_013]|uniref:hypothetical protein n=1 Tax=Micromonospora sp. LOL_013 TaxID=3345414 RepID=UPI003A83BE74
MIAVAVGYATEMVANRGGLSWTIGFLVLVLATTAIQMWLARSDSRREVPNEPVVVPPATEQVVASGEGAVAIRGSVKKGGSVSTDPAAQPGTESVPPPVTGDGLTASGRGSVAIGGDAEGPIRTDGNRGPQPE